MAAAGSTLRSASDGTHFLGSSGWFPCENFSARAFAGYNWQEADENSANEYEKLDIGAGVAATLRF